MSSNEGWVDCTGNRCPVNENALVEAVLTSGVTVTRRAAEVYWGYPREGRARVLRYRTVEPEKEVKDMSTETVEQVEPNVKYNAETNKDVGVKADGGKPNIVQGCMWYFPRALQAVADQSRFGKEKYNLDYSDKNFLRVAGGIERYTDGLGRHLLGETIDGKLDPESGLPHAYAVAWNALARLEMMLIEEEKQSDSK